MLFPALILIPESLYHASRDPTYGASVPQFGQFRRAARFVAEKYKGQVLHRLGWLALANFVAAFIGTYLEMKAANRILVLVEDDPSLLVIPEQKDTAFSRFRQKVSSVMS